MPAVGQPRTPWPGVGCDEQTQKMCQMADEIRFPIPGSLQAGCSKRSYQRSLGRGCRSGAREAAEGVSASIVQSLIVRAGTRGGERAHTGDM
jgi:hypothetical protein